MMFGPDAERALFILAALAVASVFGVGFLSCWVLLELISGVIFW